MNNEHKPLTAADIEMLRVTSTKDEPTLADMADAFEALPRLLSMLQPPTDAAVREAVERLEYVAETMEGWRRPMEAAPTYKVPAHLLPSDLRTLLSYVRAVQSPMLTGEQVEAVRHVDEVLRRNGLKNAQRFLRAAFPGVFGKEG